MSMCCVKRFVGLDLLVDAVPGVRGGSDSAVVDCVAAQVALWQVCVDDGKPVRAVGLASFRDHSGLVAAQGGEPFDAAMTHRGRGLRTDAAHLNAAATTGAAVMVTVTPGLMVRQTPADGGVPRGTMVTRRAPHTNLIVSRRC